MLILWVVVVLLAMPLILELMLWCMILFTQVLHMLITPFIELIVFLTGSGKSDTAKKY